MWPHSVGLMPPQDIVRRVTGLMEGDYKRGYKKRILYSSEVT